MIQRIQTVYFSLIALISLLLLEGSFLVFTEKTGTIIRVTFNGIFRENSAKGLELIEKLLPLSVLIILIPLISLVTIFLFKNRKIQMRITLILVSLIVILMLAFIHISQSVISKFDAGIIPVLKMFLPLIILLLSILAYRRIKKDDRLVKSYDRLR
jgi:hypothetical protein